MIIEDIKPIDIPQNAPFNGSREGRLDIPQNAPFNGSREGRLECRSEIIIVITPADTGRLIINKTDVKNIDQQYRGKNRKKTLVRGFDE